MCAHLYKLPLYKFFSQFFKHLFISHFIGQFKCQQFCCNTTLQYFPHVCFQFCLKRRYCCAFTYSDVFHTHIYFQQSLSSRTTVEYVPPLFFLFQFYFDFDTSCTSIPRHITSETQQEMRLFPHRHLSYSDAHLTGCHISTAFIRPSIY